MTESTGELGTGFSVDVARTWEDALFEGELPGTRRVALRSAIVLGEGGVLGTLRVITRFGLGGSHWDGRWPINRARQAAKTGHEFRARRGSQRFSWIHIDDVARIVDFLEAHPELEGPINASSPNPSDDRTLMRTVRRVLGVPFGPPLMRWVQEIGAIFIKTETELVLKSRWVVPERLEAAGFEFTHPHLEGAVRASFEK